MRHLEPELKAAGGLYSPSTGIVDSHGLMSALLADAQAAGALLAVTSGMASAQQAEATAAEQKANPQPSTRRHGLRLDGAHPPRTRRESEKRASWAPAQE